MTAPAYPPGAYRFVDREYLNIVYRTDPDAPRALVPEPLEIDDPLVRFDVVVKGAWTGPARLQLNAHVLAPLADLPVLEIVDVSHIATDLTLAPVEPVHDYLNGDR